MADFGSQQGTSRRHMNRKEHRVAKKTGLAPAQPAPVAVLFGRAIEAHQGGNLAAAEALYRQVLALQPNHADALQLLGVAAHQAGRHDIAVDLISRAIALNDRAPHFHANLGQVLRMTGRLDAAAASYRRALALQPDYLDVLMGLGVLLQAKGEMAEAASCYRRALALNPDLAEGHNNLGNALEEQGKLGAAIASYEQAVALRPQDVGMIYNLAAALINDGQVMKALPLARRGMQITKTAELTTLVGDCVKELHGDGGNAELRALVVRALSEPWGRPQDFAAAAIEIVKEGGRYAAATEAGLGEAAEDDLLQAMLESVMIGDLELERFLTRMRRTLLDLAISASGEAAIDAKVLQFCCALARQCFIDDYVYDRGDDEWTRVQALRDAVAAAIEAGGSVPAIQLAAVGAYLPLGQARGADRLLDQVWPAPIAALLTQQLREPAQERALAGALPTLTAIDDRVSRAVQSQYEANPYPRWVKAAPAVTPTHVDAYLAKSFPRVPFHPLGKGSAIDLLVAGCGTGQHSIETAQLFAGARMLAIDLSRASLAFAKRQSAARGLSSIDYAQADILELGALGRSFDVIESSGVLHHLADPFAGWRVLLSLLRPHGLMRLGFYSELARQDVVAAREFIAARGFGGSADEIRRARQELIAAGEEAPFASLTRSADFYGTSACRDLLFHVQEHRLTIPEIAAFIKGHGLRFIGFEIDRRVTTQYRARFPTDETMTDLDHWHRFESDNPLTFRGMYQFWVQKEG
jgi:Flp pilus assembly protein TadD/2-polyprenyl-3-methyl-5-hydroxy-6-metoxy-1,4-benzoquinol methylase